MLSKWSERSFMGRPGAPILPIQKPASQQPTALQRLADLQRHADAQQRQADSPISYAFNVPFTSDLPGPNTEDIIHATTDAVLRWTHPADSPDDVQVYHLPIHVQNLEHLSRRCADLSASSMAVEAHLISTTPPTAKGQQITTICLFGLPEQVYKARGMILQDSPVSLRCVTIDVDGHLVCDLAAGVLKQDVTAVLDNISAFCGVALFLLGPKLTPMLDLTGDAEMWIDRRWRIAIYGDSQSAEHAKIRVLTHIDSLLGRIVETVKIDMSLHQLICGHDRKNITLIESSTGTAVYFPPSFAHLFFYCAPEATRRDPSEVFITGEKVENINEAKRRLNEISAGIRVYARDLTITPAKIDGLLLGRLDKLRKILETNGTSVLFPTLASQQNMLRVQGGELSHVEQTVRELMTLAGQFYSAAWAFQQVDARLQLGSAGLRTLLGDICAVSGAEVAYEKMIFTINGLDDSVKAALKAISDTPLASQSQYQIRVRFELNSECKEFVSGKKNGKINKIMGQSNVKIVFSSSNDLNFNVDVQTSNYNSLVRGLTLVEQEMPASISFHIPVQYHKRIIGMGGQHIQRIMKKHSVFVKFSNVLDRGTGAETELDNVLCRTPARNAQNLDAVKNEILDMVDRDDSECTSQIVNIDRLYHRQLLARLPKLESLESRHKCKIVLPSTEQASDEVTVTGPQWQVTHCVDDLLGMVPDKHELVLAGSAELLKFLKSPNFSREIAAKLKTQYEVEIAVPKLSENYDADNSPTITLMWAFTRNNAGGLRDAMDFLQSQCTTSGVDFVVLKGVIHRPKSDSFEDSLQFFNRKLLQHAPSLLTTDSPIKPAFGDEVARERSTIFDRLRRPGGMSSISAFLDRRKNSSRSINSTFFQGSNNVSKSSLISIESARSFNADRNPWNDSGVNLTEEDNIWVTRTTSSILDGTILPNTKIRPGDATPRHSTRPSADSGRPSTSHSLTSGYPGLIGSYR